MSHFSALKRRLLGAAVVGAAIAAPMLMAAPAGAASGSCTFNPDGTVTVFSGTCNLVSSDVVKGVHVYAGGTLVANGARIEGDVNVTGGTARLLTTTVVSGNVNFANATGNNTVCGTSVGGDVRATGTPAGSEVTIGGQFCQSGFAVSGNVVLYKNSGRHVIAGYVVGQSVQVQNNTTAEPIQLSRNRIMGNLSCSGNTPAPFRFRNTVDGTASGQCA